jgi:hypothetical protein
MGRNKKTNYMFFLFYLTIPELYRNYKVGIICIFRVDLID